MSTTTQNGSNRVKKELRRYSNRKKREGSKIVVVLLGASKYMQSTVQEPKPEKKNYKYDKDLLERRYRPRT